MQGHAECDQTTGAWVVTWTVENDHRTDATLTGFRAMPPTPVEFSGVLDNTPGQGGPIVPHASQGVRGAITGVQRVAGDASGASLEVDATWPDDQYRASARGEVTFDRRCGPPPVDCVHLDQARYRHTFDGPNGRATIRLDGGRPMCDGESQAFSLVSYYAPEPDFATPQYMFDTDSARIDAHSPSIELRVDVPRCNTQVDLIFGDERAVIDTLVDGGPRYGNLKLGVTGEGNAPGNRSTGPDGWYNGGSGTCAQPAVQFVSACDGSVTVKLGNGGGGRYPAPFVVVAAGGFSTERSVPPGAGEQVLVPAASAGDITVTMDGKPVASGAWQRPADCAPPVVTATSDCTSLAVTITNPAGGVPVSAVATPSTGTRRELSVPAGAAASATFPAPASGFTVMVAIGTELFQATYLKPATCTADGGVPPSGTPGVSGGGGGTGGGAGLATTGVRAGLTVTAGLVLLAAGAGLFHLFRRRRIRFTA